MSVTRRECRDYPAAERNPVDIYVSHRVGERLTVSFRLAKLSNRDDGIDS